MCRSKFLLINFGNAKIGGNIIYALTMKCYLCNNESTSKEHCPAKSFFPSNKRINLIKNPSCSIHNEDTSSDDEYVRNLILITKGNNEIANRHFRDKGFRSFQRSPKLLSLMTKNPKQLNFIKDDESSKNLVFEIERDRFDRVLRKIGYGIYYYTFKQTWNHKLDVATHHLITDNLKTDLIAELIQHYNSKSEFKITYEGSNPDVFKYSFLNHSSGNKILVMKFYEWFEVWIVPKKSSFEASLDL